MTLVARLKVTLSDVEPQVLRRFDVPLKIKLNRLHDVIQAAMGWADSHLYEFRAGGVGWGVPDSDGYYDGPLPASKTSLLDVLVSMRRRPLPRLIDQTGFGTAFGLRGFGAHFLVRRSKLSRIRPISASSGSNCPPCHSSIRSCSSCLGSAMASRKSA